MQKSDFAIVMEHDELADYLGRISIPPTNALQLTMLCRLDAS